MGYFSACFTHQLTGLDRCGCGPCCRRCNNCGCFDFCFNRGELPREDYAMEKQQRELEAQRRLERQQGEQLLPYPGEPQMQVPTAAPPQT